MATTHNIVLVKDHRNKKYGFLKLRTITNRKAKDKSLKIKIQADNWNSVKQYVYAREPKAEEINEAIQNVLLDARGGKSALIHQKGGNKSFLNYTEKIISVISTRNTKRGRVDAISKFKEYLISKGQEDIYFEEIDLFLVRSYYGYLLDSGLAVSTANEYMTVLRYFVNQVNENGLHLYISDPFKGLKKKKHQKKYRVLTDEELMSFMDYQPKKHTTKIVKHTFLFMMYAAGIRISDALLLTWKNFYRVGEGYFVTYKTQKTGKQMTTKLSLEAMEELNIFIQEFYPDLLHDINKLEISRIQLQHEIKKDKDENNGILMNSFFRLQEEYEIEQELGTDVTWEKIIARERKKEARKSYLETQLRRKLQLLEGLDQEKIGLLGKKLLELKQSEPNQTVLPFMREHYKGEKNMTPEVAKKWHLSKTKINGQLKKIQKEQGIKTSISNHQARHVFAQRLFLSGANIHYISMALGHSSLSITENYREQLVTDDAMDVTESFSLTIRNRPYARKKTITTVYDAPES